MKIEIDLNRYDLEQLLKILFACKVTLEEQGDVPSDAYYSIEKIGKLLFDYAVSNNENDILQELQSFGERRMEELEK